MSTRIRVALVEPDGKAVYIGLKAALDRMAAYYGHKAARMHGVAGWKQCVEMAKTMRAAAARSGVQYKLKLWVWREPKHCRRSKSEFFKLVDRIKGKRPPMIRAGRGVRKELADVVKLQFRPAGGRWGEVPAPAQARVIVPQNNEQQPPWNLAGLAGAMAGNANLVVDGAGNYAYVNAPIQAQAEPQPEPVVNVDWERLHKMARDMDYDGVPQPPNDEEF